MKNKWSNRIVVWTFLIIILIGIIIFGSQLYAQIIDETSLTLDTGQLYNNSLLTKPIQTKLEKATIDIETKYKNVKVIRELCASPKEYENAKKQNKTIDCTTITANLSASAYEVNISGKRGIKLVRN